MIVAIRVDAVSSVRVPIGSVSGIITVVPAIVVVLAGIIVSVPRLADSVESTKIFGFTVHQAEAQVLQVWADRKQVSPDGHVGHPGLGVGHRTLQSH